MSTLFTFGQKRISLFFLFSAIFFLFFSAPKTRASATELPIDASAYKFARLTLGHDLITPEEIMRTYRGVVYTEAQLDGFKNSVPSEEVILWCRDNGFLLIAGPTKPLSFLEIGDLNHSCTTINERFAHDDKVGIGWLMIRKGAIKGSFSKDLAEQTALLSRLEYVPNVAEIAWASYIYGAVRRVYLVPNLRFVRTSSVSCLGHHASIGFFGHGPLFFPHYIDSDRQSPLGIISARKKLKSGS